MTGKDEQLVRLNDEAHSDAAALAGIVDFVPSAKDRVREVAGTVDRALDLARREMPWDPSSIYAVLVGYRVVGRLQDCKIYLADCRAHLQSRNNPTFTKMYDQFADRLTRATW